MFIINVSTFTPSPDVHSFLPPALPAWNRRMFRGIYHGLFLFISPTIPSIKHSSTRLTPPRPPSVTSWLVANIQAPYLFSTVWSLIKPWLDEATVRKIHILGRNYKSELQQYIAPENLPVDLGGKCRCERDGGCSLSNAGPWTTPAPAAA
jgi:hypothetical protein